MNYRITIDTTNINNTYWVYKDSRSELKYFFKVSNPDKQVVRIVVNEKKNKPSSGTQGITFINYNTFIGNYMCHKKFAESDRNKDYKGIIVFHQTTEKLYNYYFEEILSLLRN